MGLVSAIQIGRSALVSSQVGLQVAGNNLANAATPGYTRQVAFFQPTKGELEGQFTLGRGVGVRAVRRQIDEALQTRLRESISAQRAAETRFATLGQLESVLNELSGFDLSTELSSFFNAWSEASNLTEADAVVIEQGDRLARFIGTLRGEIDGLRSQLETQLDARTVQLNELLGQAAELNVAIAGGELGQSSANALRDQRDEVLGEIAALTDITVIEDASGVADVLIGSTPVVVAGTARRLTVDRDSDGNRVTARIVLEDSGSPLGVNSGSLGGLLAARDDTIDDVLDRLDRIATSLIFEVNRLHSTATGVAGFTDEAGTLAVPAADRGLPLNSPANATFAALPFTLTNGGFTVNVTDKATGSVTQRRIEVDLDGINDAFASNFVDDTTPDDILAAIDSIPGLNASFTPDGRLRVQASPGFEFSFSDDTSGIVAALGINSFFTGTGSADIAVRDELLADPSGLRTGRLVDGQFVENETALAISELRGRTLGELSGLTVESFWADAAQAVSVRVGSAETGAEAARVVRESVESQRASVSGVSVDEESINLLSFQRQFEGAARVIQTADELLQTLIAIL